MTQRNARPRDDQSREAGQGSVQASEPTGSVPPGADTALTTRHRLVEDEIWCAYLDGVAAGLREANTRMAQAIADALDGPNGYGLETAPVPAKDAIRRMLRGMVGVR